MVNTARPARREGRGVDDPETARIFALIPHCGLRCQSPRNMATWPRKLHR
jgi:hypothetical protein